VTDPASFVAPEDSGETKSGVCGSVCWLSAAAGLPAASAGGAAAEAEGGTYSSLPFSDAGAFAEPRTSELPLVDPEESKLEV
jgi:hypothetical protein